jgi:subtilase family serine protease
LFDTAGRKVLNEFEAFYERAVDEDITLLAATGDSGTENVDVNGNPYSFPTVDFPASSPHVTAVGATTLNLDAKDQYLSETVWNNGGASGGGVSQFFPEPKYQYLLPMSVQKTLNGRRGIPDVAFNGDPNTPIWVYLGYFPNPPDNGFYAAGSGTSAGTAQWAGIVADVSQFAGRPLGFLNPKLYGTSAGSEQSEFFHDITMGDNSFNGLPGYKATVGWDLASGWGTPSLGRNLWELRKER